MSKIQYYDMFSDFICLCFWFFFKLFNHLCSRKNHMFIASRMYNIVQRVKAGKKKLKATIMKLVPQGCPVPASTVALNLWVLGTRCNKKETNKKGVSSMERVMFTYPSLPNIFWIGAGGLQNTSWGSAQIPQQKQSFWGSWKTRTTTNIFLVLLPASKMSTTNDWKTFC